MSFRLTTQKVLFASSLIMSGYILTANAKDPVATVAPPSSVPSTTLVAPTDNTASAQTTNNTKTTEAESAAPSSTSTDSNLTEQSKSADEKETKEEVKDNQATSANVNATTSESAAPSENVATPQQKETVATPTETKTPDAAPAATPSSASPSMTEQPKELDKKESQPGEAASTSTSSAPAESTSVSENIATPEKKEAVTVTTTPTETKEFKLDSEEQKRAYASGIALGHYIEAQIAQQKELHITLDKNIMLAGVADAFNKQEKMNEKEVRDTLLVLEEQINVLTEDKNNKRIAADKTWMEQFAKREGVKKTKQGLLYLIINKGSGPALQSTDIVELSFKGTLVDGTVVDGPKVDNAYQVFKVDNIPPLLRDSVKLIRKGGEIQIAIPPSAIKVPDGSKKPEFVVIYTISVIDVNKPQ